MEQHLLNLTTKTSLQHNSLRFDDNLVNSMKIVCISNPSPGRGGNAGTSLQVWHISGKVGDWPKMVDGFKHRAQVVWSSPSSGGELRVFLSACNFSDENLSSFAQNSTSSLFRNSARETAFHDLLMGLVRGAVFHHGRGARKPPIGLTRPFPSLLDVFSTFNWPFAPKALMGHIFLQRFQWKTQGCGRAPQLFRP